MNSVSNANLPETEKPSEPRPFSRRLLLTLLLGILAVTVSLGVRNSSWAKERRLRSLSVEELALAIHDDPGDALTFAYYGSALLKAGDGPDSVKAYEQALHLSPRMTRAQLGLATALLHEHQLKAAKEAFEATLHREPKNPEAYMGLSQVFYQAGSPKMAIDPLKTVTQLQPDNAPAWYYLGKLYGDSHQPALAMEALKRATALKPDQADFWRDLGQVTRYQALYAEAEQDFKKALALNPKDAVTHFWLGQLYMAQADTPALRGHAEEEFHAALKLDPELHQVYFDLGQVYERQGQWKQAVEYFRKARDRDLSDYQALYHLGFCLVKTGEVAEGKRLIAGSQALGEARRAIEDLTNRILADPKNRELHLQLARLYRKYGNEDGAMSEYSVYQRMGANDPGVAKEMETLKTTMPVPQPPPSGLPAPETGVRE